MRKTTACLLFTIISLAMLSSCRDSYTICYENKNVLTQAKLFRPVSGSPVPFNAPSVTLTSLATGLNTYSGDANLNFINFPFNPTVTSMRYALKVSQVMAADTLTFNYSVQNKPLSDACGAIDIFNLTSVTTTTNSIDSVRIISAMVDNTVKENVRIFFKP